MCRSIKILRGAEVEATREEISAAALQFVRKVSGYRKPSRANEPAFNSAIAEIAGSVERLLTQLETSGQTRSREPEAVLAIPLPES
jgi:hypothetical protein